MSESTPPQLEASLLFLPLVRASPLSSVKLHFVFPLFLCVSRSAETKSVSCCSTSYFNPCHVSLVHMSSFLCLSLFFLMCSHRQTHNPTSHRSLKARALSVLRPNPRAPAFPLCFPLPPPANLRPHPLSPSPLCTKRRQ